MCPGSLLKAANADFLCDWNDGSQDQNILATPLQFINPQI